ncbi:cytochrome-c peroxidase [Pseudochelatococcus lubricantis]|uniref:cytochrome-c peroxidase n=1 Tax=Pseudochelatococcus lubricantis TaxID=1538102 RepID=UPI0035EE9915
MLRGARYLFVAALLGLVPARGSSDGALRAAYSGPVSEWPAATLDNGVNFVEFAPLPVTTAAEGAARKAVLGARLFADPALSVNGSLSCASCHDPAAGFTIRSAHALGHDGTPGLRNPTALLDTPARSAFGWDGAPVSLHERLLMPLTDRSEMGNPGLGDVLARIKEAPGYRASFGEAFGTSGIDAPRLAEALAAYLVAQPRENRFDRFLAGDHNALSDREIEGLHLFRTKAGCANCHFGPRLTDDGFHNLRLSSFREPREDLGRYRVTSRPEDIGRFQTPSLRSVADTAPYMHHGHVGSLEGVVNFYARGGGEVWARNAREAADPMYPHAAALSPHIRPLDLGAEEKAALVAFLKTL